MLLIPFDRNVDWRRPPVATLFLILLNVSVFVVFQSGDDARLQEAVDFYQKSGLAQIEGPIYVEYLQDKGETPPDLARKSAYPEWIFSLQTDFEFQRQIQSRSLIPRDAKNYPQWLAKRQQFEQRLTHVVFWHYGLKTAEVDPLELISHMFLHGGFMHLFGNMFFLFAVGFLVESTFGAWTYLAAYLLSGLGAALFDFIFTPDRLIPGIGASGAVSGLMGMYAVLFWTRSIRFFYFVFVYFGFARMPALVLLPLWLANEFYQLLAYAESSTNYIAHLGGLVCGGLIGFAIRRFSSAYSLQRFETEDRDRAYAEELEQAEILCEGLEFNRARPLLKRLHAQDPLNPRVMHLLYQCLSTHPADAAYHALSHKILLLPDRGHGTDEWVMETYREYLQRAKPAPKMNARLVYALAERFIAMSEHREAERLVKSLLRREQLDSRVLQLARSLGNLLLEKGNPERGQIYLDLANRLDRPDAATVAVSETRSGRGDPENG